MSSPAAAPGVFLNGLLDYDSMLAALTLSLLAMGVTRADGPGVFVVIWPGESTPALEAFAEDALRVQLRRSSPGGRPTQAEFLGGRFAHAAGSYSQHGGAELEDAGTLPRLLAGEGYHTFAAGRWYEGRPADFGLEDARQGSLAEVLGAEPGPRFLWWAPPQADASAVEQLEELLDFRAQHARTVIAAVFFDVAPEGNDARIDSTSESALVTELLLAGPGIDPRQQQVRGSPVDVAPTLLTLVGATRPSAMQGTDLLTSDPERLLAGAIYDSRARKGGLHPENDAKALHLRHGRWKYVLYLQDIVEHRDKEELDTEEVEGHPGGAQELFDLDADPEGRENLADEPEHAEQLAHLRAEALTWWQDTGGEALSLPWLLPALGPPPSEKLPNIVLVISDDQDADHLGFQGNPVARTPTLDALAAEGVFFSVAHVVMSRCRPSLAALLSGRYPHENLIHDNTSKGLLARRDSLPNLLKQAGYATFKGGKFWEGSPAGMGFLDGAPYRTFVREDGQTELFAFLREHSGERPFFVWWAPMLPHSPFDPPERHRAPFASVELEPPPGTPDADAWREDERTSYAMGTWLDEGFASLCDELRKLGEYDNTLFCFLIDNGWSNDTPSKGTVFEEGVQTPLVFSWKNGLGGGKRATGLASTIDVYATLLDFAGVEAPSDVPSRSLRSTLESSAPRGRDAVCGVGYRRARGSSILDDAYAIYVRTERWKYVQYLVNVDDEAQFRFQHGQAPFPARRRGERELFDLSNDPEELTNLAGEPEQEERLAELHEIFLEWWRENGEGELALPGQRNKTPRESRRKPPTPK